MTYKLSKITEQIGLSFTGKDIGIDGIHTLSEATPAQLSFLQMPNMHHNLPQQKRQQY